jgi:polysaccharide biosynthesis protein PslH
MIKSRPPSRGLSGKTVAVVHPAWHSCGTYRVILGQIEAYRSLGARVMPIAVSNDPGFLPDRKWLWRSFVNASPEVSTGERYFAGAPFATIFDPRFLIKTIWPYMHGDQAAIRTGMAAHARLPPSVENSSFDLVHCNHFFLMPVARRLSRRQRAPIFLETHDIQADQFSKMNKVLRPIPPITSHQCMLAQELEQMRDASLLIHINKDEASEFSRLLPNVSHKLIYPMVPDVSAGGSGNDILIVASNNVGNVDSVIWFLENVAPHLSGI